MQSNSNAPFRAIEKILSGKFDGQSNLAIGEKVSRLNALSGS